MTLVTKGGMVMSREEKKDPSRNVGPRERLSVESALIRL